MKKFYLFIILIFSAGVLSAAPLNTLVVNNGNWKTATSWSLARVPADGDSVLIPAGYTALVNSSLNYSSLNFHIAVYGALFVTQSGTFKIGVNSVITVYAGGIIKADLTDNDPAQGTIQIGGVVKFSDADGMNISGPVFASKTTGTDPNGFSSFSILPVVFVNFTALRHSANSVELTWATEHEMNNKQFVVEKSANSTDWNEIGIVLPGNDQQVNSYQYKDQTASSAASYYRVKQVDLDGHFMYSDVKLIRADASNTTVSIFAANKTITVRANSEMKSKVEVSLISMNGIVLQQRQLDNASSSIAFSAGNVPSGIYIVRVMDNNSLIAVKEVMLN